MRNKQIYVVPQSWKIDLTAIGTFHLLAPSGSTDTGVSLPNGGDDDEGLEGDAKPYNFSAWE